MLQCVLSFSTPVKPGLSELRMNSDSTYLFILVSLELIAPNGVIISYAGHSDVVMGALVTRNRSELHNQFRFIQMAVGAVPSPFDCMLCLRGLRTLPVRMKAHMRNGLIVAMMLEKHPMVEEVLHPGTCVIVLTSSENIYCFFLKFLHLPHYCRTD
ncbi:unnamed protein product [Trichobilharzia regenti]|nr:unnamed protein product [Trichobilharzia regenti]